MHKAIHGVDPDEKKKITLTDFQTSCSDCKCSRSEFVQFFVTDWSGFRYLHIYLKITVDLQPNVIFMWHTEIIALIVEGSFRTF